jgi:hypothetical protein
MHQIEKDSSHYQPSFFLNKFYSEGYRELFFPMDRKLFSNLMKLTYHIRLCNFVLLHYYSSIRVNTYISYTALREIISCC